jgi:hypothetical protein
MAGMGEAQDSGALNAMRAQQLGLQAQELRGKLGLLNATPPPIYGGAPNTAGPNAVAPGGQAAPTGLLPSLVKGAESEGLANQLGISPYDIGFGGADLSKAPKDENGFPIWEGKQGPQGMSHAAGAYQFQPATWAEYAGPLGIKDFSPASQDRVFHAAVADKGLQPWMANPKIAALVNTGQFGGSGSSMPPQPGLIAQPAGNAAPRGILSSSPSNFDASGQYHDPPLSTWAPPAPAGGLLAQAGSGQPPAPSPQPQPSPAGGIMPGGAMMPGGINPAYIQWAQQQANARSAFGVPVPGYMNEAGALPFVGPKAAATANATNQSDLQYKPLIAGATAAREYPYKVGEAQAGPAERGSQERQTKAFEVGLQPIQQRNDVLKGEYEKNVVEPFNAAQKALQPLSQIENAMANFQTGPSAENRLRLMRAWQDLKGYAGMDPNSETAKSIASGEIINKSGTTLGFELARTLGSREAQIDRDAGDQSQSRPRQQP